MLCYSLRQSHGEYSPYLLTADRQGLCLKISKHQEIFHQSISQFSKKKPHLPSLPSKSPPHHDHHFQLNQEILNWPDFRQVISKELHSRCFQDNFRLTWLRKIGVWTKNRSNKSFLGDKLKLLNNSRGKNHDRSSGPSTTWDVLRERHQLDNMSISLWVLLCEHSSLGNLIYLNSFTHQKVSERLTNAGKKTEQLIFETTGIKFKKEKKKKVRQGFFVDHCQCVYWTRRCCLTFSS